MASQPEEKPVRLSSDNDDQTLPVDTPAEIEEAQPQQQTQQQATGTYLSGVRLFLVITSLTIVMFLAMLDISIVGTAIPQMTSDFKTLTDVGWYVGAYQLASATLQPFTGKLYTYFSSKWTMLCALFVFEVGSAICGSAVTSVMFIIGRAVSGVGSAGLMNGALTIILGAIRPEVRPLYTGMAMGVGQIGIVLGPVLGGAFTERASWRWCFYINIPLGFIAALFMLVIHIPEMIEKQPVVFSRALITKFDLPGFAIFAPAAIMLLLALQYASGEHGWSSPVVIGLLCGAVVAGCLFVYWEHRVGESAMMPLSMMRRRVVWCSYLFFSCLMCVLIVGSNFMPIYLQSVRGLSPLMSGVYLLASVLPQIMFILISGALLSKIGYYLPWAAAAGVIASIGCGLISTWRPWTTLGPIVGYQIVIAARGAGMQVPTLAVQNALPPKQQALGTGALVFFQNFSSAIFITVANAVFQAVLKSEIRANAPEVPVEAAIAAGGSAEAVRQLAPPGPVLDGILLAYSRGFASVMYMLAAIGIVGVVASLGMGWVDLRKTGRAEVEGRTHGAKDETKDETQEEIKSA